MARFIRDFLILTEEIVAIYKNYVQKVSTKVKRSFNSIVSTSEVPVIFFKSAQDGRE
jgi:hypothetical protein